MVRRHRQILDEMQILYVIERTQTGVLCVVTMISFGLTKSLPELLFCTLSHLSESDE